MREIKHLSIHQWLRSAIPDSQQPTSPIGFLFLKLPPPPCAVLLVIYNYGYDVTLVDCQLAWGNADKLINGNRLWPGLFTVSVNCSLCIAQVVSYTPRTYTSLHEQANLAAELYMASQLRNGKGQGRSTLHKAPALNICDPVIQRNPLISIAWSQTDMTCMALALGTLLPQPLEL